MSPLSSSSLISVTPSLVYPRDEEMEDVEEEREEDKKEEREKREEKEKEEEEEEEKGEKRKTWEDFDETIPIGWYWDRVDLTPLNPVNEKSLFPLFVIPITRRTVQVVVCLDDFVVVVKKRIREQLQKDGQYVPPLDGFCLVPQIPVGNRDVLDDNKKLGDYPCAKDWEFWFSVLIEYFSKPPNPIPKHLRLKYSRPSPAETRYSGPFDDVE